MNCRIIPKLSGSICEYSEIEIFRNNSEIMYLGTSFSLQLDIRSNFQKEYQSSLCITRMRSEINHEMLKDFRFEVAKSEPREEALVLVTKFEG